jgi:hypothetical protein
MGQAVTAWAPAAEKKITRKRVGFKRVVVELTEAHYDALAKLAIEDIRRGGPTEMLSVICRLNLDTLIKAHRPAQLSLVPGKLNTALGE